MLGHRDGLIRRPSVQWQGLIESVVRRNSHSAPGDVVDPVIDRVRWSGTRTMIGQTFDALEHTHSFACYDIIVTNKTS
jgi:hypothetical protein